MGKARSLFLTEDDLVNLPSSGGVPYLVGVKDGKLCLYRTSDDMTYTLFGSDAGDSVVLIDGASVTVGARQTLSGTFTGVLSVTTNDLREMYVDGNLSTNLSSSTGGNETLDVLELHYHNSHVADLSYALIGFSALKRCVIDGCVATDCHELFTNCYNLESIDISGCDMNAYAATTLQSMFYACTSLSTLVCDFSRWNIPLVTSMHQMFDMCSALGSLDMSGLGTGSVQDFFSTFGTMTMLKTLDLSGWDMSGATDAHQMFYMAQNLETFNLGDGFNLSGCVGNTSLLSMSFMYYKLANVTGTVSGVKVSLDLSYSPLTRDSALVFINGLSSEPVDGCPTLTFSSSSTKDLLTEDDIAISTAKGPLHNKERFNRFTQALEFG